jgi:hypothetical protein
MRTCSAPRAATIASTVVFALAACAHAGGPDGAAGPPAGGWPQLQNGQLTDKMCKLLTPADYKRFGHNQLLALEAQAAGAKPAGNYVSCSAPPADSLTMTLQPTAEAAKIWYAGGLMFRRHEVEEKNRDSVLAENVVPGVDESWFDYWLDSGGDDKLKDYELRLRRGALVASLQLTGVDVSKEKDPKATLVALAKLVLERMPDVGRSDTGTTPMVHFDVKGRGKAALVQYSVPDGGTKKLENTDLPWSVDAPMADHGEQPITLSVTVQTDGQLPVSCAITVAGKVVHQSQGPGFAICNGMYSGR